MTKLASATPGFMEKLNEAIRRDVLPVLGRLPAYGKLIYLLAKDSTLTPRDKSALFVAIGYQISPIDLIPGFIPVIGQMDDLLVMLWGIRHTLSRLSDERGDEYLASAKLTREQIEADAALVRHALGEMVSQGARAAGRGAMTLLKAGAVAGAFLGYFVWYALRKKRR